MSIARHLNGLAHWWPRPAPRRLLIVGSSGSGKSTLGHWLGQFYQLPVYELDDLAWQPGWQLHPLDEIRERVATVVAQPEWILVGNYHRTQDLSWQEAEGVIWLDLSLQRQFYRLIWRCLKRALLRQACCNGNFESLRMTFASRESLLLWLLKSHADVRARYLQHSQAATGPWVLHLPEVQAVRHFQHRLQGLRP